MLGDAPCKELRLSGHEPDAYSPMHEVQTSGVGRLPSKPRQSRSAPDKPRVRTDCPINVGHAGSAASVGDGK